MTIPMVLGQMGASILIGQFISRFGKWKRWMVGGSVLVLIGVSLMSTLRYNTDFVWVSVYMVVLGAGLGMVMQNLSLVVQNDTPPEQLGAATSNVSFFRSVAGAIGVTIMGSILASQVTSHIKESLDGFVPSSASEVDALKALGTGNLPDVASLPQAVRVIVESAYGNGIADAFIVAIPLAFISLIAIIFLPNKALSTKTATQTLAETAEESAIDLAEAEVGAATTGSVAVANSANRAGGDR
jgi:MFS family permease